MGVMSDMATILKGLAHESVNLTDLDNELFVTPVAHIRAADAAAGDVMAETPWLPYGGPGSIKVTNVVVAQSDVITADPTNHAVVTVRIRNAGGIVATATFSTATNSMNPFQAFVIPAIEWDAAPIIETLSILTLEITKPGTGVQLGALSVTVVAKQV